MREKYVRSGRLGGGFRRKFIGDRAFYKAVITLVLPVVIQNIISNFVNLLDNIMVGQIGTLQMSGVAIVNQLMFVFNLTIFGGLAGPGIFGAQFYGAGDNKGIRSTFRFKIWIAVAIFVAGIAILLSNGSSLIELYLKGEGTAADAAAILEFGKEYLQVMLWGLLPFAISQVYSGTLRETGETVLPMKASIAAVFINLCLNYILIYGKIGFPVMGVRGAAIATVISRYAELGIILIYTHKHIRRFPYMEGVYRSLKIPVKLSLSIAKKGFPLLANELLWSMGMTTLTQIFSTCGLNVVAGLNISSTITNLFNVFFVSMGIAVSVMIGQYLGAGEIKQAKECVWKLIFFSVCISLVIGGILAAASPVIPRIYNTTDDVRRLATYFMLTGAVYMAFNSITHCCYFAFRSGGKTFATFLFDSVYTWVVCVPFTYVIVNFTGLNIMVLYPICYFTDVIKSIVGILMLRTGFWAQNIVSDK